MEQEIRNAIGLGSPELQPEEKPAPPPPVTIHDFSKLLAENEPPKRR